MNSEKCIPYWLSLYSPIVITIASDEVEKCCMKRNLTFKSMLSLYSSMEDVIVPISLGDSETFLTSLSIRFESFEDIKEKNIEDIEENIKKNIKNSNYLYKKNRNLINNIIKYSEYPSLSSFSSKSLSTSKLYQHYSSSTLWNTYNINKLFLKSFCNSNDFAINSIYLIVTAISVKDNNPLQVMSELSIKYNEVEEYLKENCLKKNETKRIFLIISEEDEDDNDNINQILLNFINNYPKDCIKNLKLSSSKNYKIKNIINQTNYRIKYNKMNNNKNNSNNYLTLIDKNNIIKFLYWLLLEHITPEIEGRINIINEKISNFNIKEKLVNYLLSIRLNKYNLYLGNLYFLLKNYDKSFYYYKELKNSIKIRENNYYNFIYYLIMYSLSGILSKNITSSDLIAVLDYITSELIRITEVSIDNKNVINDDNNIKSKLFYIVYSILVSDLYLLVKHDYCKSSILLHKLSSNAKKFPHIQFVLMERSLNFLLLSENKTKFIGNFYLFNLQMKSNIFIPIILNKLVILFFYVNKFHYNVIKIYILKAIIQILVDSNQIDLKLRGYLLILKILSNNVIDPKYIDNDKFSHLKEDLFYLFNTSLANLKTDIDLSGVDFRNLSVFDILFNKLDYKINQNEVKLRKILLINKNMENYLPLNNDYFIIKSNELAYLFNTLDKSYEKNFNYKLKDNEVNLFTIKNIILLNNLTRFIDIDNLSLMKSFSKVDYLIALMRHYQMKSMVEKNTDLDTAFEEKFKINSSIIEKRELLYEEIYKNYGHFLVEMNWINSEFKLKSIDVLAENILIFNEKMEERKKNRLKFNVKQYTHDQSVFNDEINDKIKALNDILSITEFKFIDIFNSIFYINEEIPFSFTVTNNCSAYICLTSFNLICNKKLVIKKLNYNFLILEPFKSIEIFVHIIPLDIGSYIIKDIELTIEEYVISNYNLKQKNSIKSRLNEFSKNNKDLINFDVIQFDLLNMNLLNSSFQLKDIKNLKDYLVNYDVFFDVDNLLHFKLLISNNNNNNLFLKNNYIKSSESQIILFYKDHLINKKGFTNTIIELDEVTKFLEEDQDKILLDLYFKPKNNSKRLILLLLFNYNGTFLIDTYIEFYLECNKNYKFYNKFYDCNTKLTNQLNLSINKYEDLKNEIKLEDKFDYKNQSLSYELIGDMNSGYNLYIDNNEVPSMDLENNYKDSSSTNYKDKFEFKLLTSFILGPCKINKKMISSKIINNERKQDVQNYLVESINSFSSQNFDRNYITYLEYDTKKRNKVTWLKRYIKLRNYDLIDSSSTLNIYPFSANKVNKNSPDQFDTNTYGNKAENNLSSASINNELKTTFSLNSNLSIPKYKKYAARTFEDVEISNNLKKIHLINLSLIKSFLFDEFLNYTMKNIKFKIKKKIESSKAKNKKVFVNYIKMKQRNKLLKNDLKNKRNANTSEDYKTFSILLKNNLNLIRENNKFSEFPYTKYIDLNYLNKLISYQELNNMCRHFNIFITCNFFTYKKNIYRTSNFEVGLIPEENSNHSPLQLETPTTISPSNIGFLSSISNLTDKEVDIEDSSSKYFQTLHDLLDSSENEKPNEINADAFVHSSYSINLELLQLKTSYEILYKTNFLHVNNLLISYNLLQDKNNSKIFFRKNNIIKINLTIFSTYKYPLKLNIFLLPYSLHKKKHQIGKLYSKYVAKFDNDISKNDDENISPTNSIFSSSSLEPTSSIYNFNESFVSSYSFSYYLHRDSNLLRNSFLNFMDYYKMYHLNFDNKDCDFIDRFDSIVEEKINNDGDELNNDNNNNNNCYYNYILYNNKTSYQDLIIKSKTKYEIIFEIIITKEGSYDINDLIIFEGLQSNNTTSCLFRLQNAKEFHVIAE